MIDVRMLREDPDGFRKALGRKRFNPTVLDSIVALDARRRESLTSVESLRATKNQVSKEISRTPADQRAEKIASQKSLGVQLEEAEKVLASIDQELDALLPGVPNPPHESVPDGDHGSEGEVVRVVGQKRAFDFTARDHLTLGELHGTLDCERAARLSGSRFAYLMGDLVHVQFGLVRMAFDRLATHGFVPVVPPIMVREKAMYGTGFFPADANEIYKIDGEDLFMVGTSEVSLAGMFMDEIIPEDKLPLRFVGYSTCLRKEAGTYGKDTRGIFRVHQFDKVEMFSFCGADRSWAEHEVLLAAEEEILQALEFHYRVINIAAGDLGAPAAKKYDLEVWLPGQGAFRELTSCSNCTDYQARRLNCRAKGEKSTKLVHTLNGTAVAIGRTLIALLETHQQSDGAVALPAALQAYLPKGLTHLRPR